MPSRGLGITLLAISVGAGVIVAGAGANYFRAQQEKSNHAIRMTAGDPRQAQAAIRQYGCAACHNIPGAPSPGGLAGPSLSGIGDRLYIGGSVENTPDNMVHWIVNPKQFNAKTAMPVTGIDLIEARNVAAYLFAH